LGKKVIQKNYLRGKKKNIAPIRGRQDNRKRDGATAGMTMEKSVAGEKRLEKKTDDRKDRTRARTL